MAIAEDKEESLRKFGLPAAAGVLGAGAGLFLTRKRNPVPSLGERGVGDLTDDLRKRLESVLHRAEPSGRTRGASGKRPDPDELEKRLREREQRRKQRRARS